MRIHWDSTTDYAIFRIGIPLGKYTNTYIVITCSESEFESEQFISRTSF